LILTTLIYMIVATIAVLAVPPAELADARAPIAYLVSDYGWLSTTGLTLISLLAGINGALVQIIMAARVAYGLAKQQQAPSWMGMINAHTRTPLYSTILMTGVILLLALFLPLTTLAKTTSMIVLVVFALVNLALFHIKGIDPDPDGEGPRYPRWIPLLGTVTCSGVLIFQVAVWIVN
ncbi:MAG: amino acid permease, partial [Gammaproteobacteria bacterium]|nr:amino acid permease [Gammaproteobacteria bacterium]